MKKLILAFLYTVSLCLVGAQDTDQTVWRTWYMTPKDGKVKQLEKGLADHVKKFHGKGSWPEEYFDVLSGPNSGSLMGFSGPHTWKAFDDRVRSQGDIDHYSKYVLPYSDNKNNSIDFWVHAPAVSYKPKIYSDSFHLSYNYIVPGTDAEYYEFLEGFKKSKELNKSSDTHEIYKTVSGENPDTWIWVYPISNMEELSGSTQLIAGGGSMAAALGEKEAERLNKIYKKVVKSRMREIIKFRPDLSTPPKE